MSQSHHPKPRIVLLCDGTWCGRETGTRTNIYRLAKLFGVNIDSPDTTEPCFRHYNPDARPDCQVSVRYRHGVGLGSGFLDYLFNGVTGQDLVAEAISAYKYIVNHYTPEHEIWMFGLSRGAYTVRCVAGMINNCGIIRRDELDDTETDLLCNEVYRIYRSDEKANQPHSHQSKEFRKRLSWPLVGDDVPSGREKAKPPVRFMGLIDTVGSLGIPEFKGGFGFQWPQFHDDIVSSVVQDVCHLMSIHDRFYIFQPCQTRRKDPKNQAGIDQEWLPGVHYDLGRQRFHFFRQGAGPLERLMAAIAALPIIGSGKAIEPNQVLADLTLWKMLQRIERHDAGHLLIPQSVLGAEMANLAGAMADGAASACARHTLVGSGDVYDRIIEYGPFGSRIGGMILRVAGQLGLWDLFFDTRDRLISDDKANVYPLHRSDPSIPLAGSIAQLGEVTEKRYPSKTPWAWALRAGRSVP